ncbi:MAG: sterol desaturase family protein [bacterium]|nr:sterol desaturase family protein [bacterium]
MSALVIAALVYAVRSRGSGRLSLGGVTSFVWPKRVWLHSSALLDYKFFAVDAILFTVVLVPFSVSAYAVADTAGIALAKVFGPADVYAVAGPVAILAFTLTLVVVGDLVRFTIHALFHHVPVLWEFHKVHHSAQVLTPVTLFRVHPLERFAYGVGSGVSFGLVLGVFEYLYPQNLTLFTVLGVNFFLIGFNFYANLRHSHVWLSFGPAVERVLISPTQHQIHHSAAPEHRDKNLGSLLAIWDWMFGSLCLAAKPEPLKLGLGTAEDADFSSLWRLYTVPIIRAAGRARPAHR